MEKITLENYDTPQQLNLTENIWYEPTAPLIFFSYERDYNKIEDKDIFVYSAMKVICDADVIEIGNIYTDERGIVKFLILKKNYLFKCRLNTEYKNIIVSDIIENPTAREKRSFILNDRKVINIMRFGAAYVVREFDENDLLVSSESAKGKINSHERFFERMDTSEFRNLKEFILEDDGLEIEGTGYFARKILEPVKHYTAIEYNVEKDKVLESEGIVYLNRKSIKPQNEMNQKYIYEFVCPPFNVEEFPPGSEIVVFLGEEENNKKIMGNIILIDDMEDDLKKVTITFKSQFNDSDLPLSGGEIKKNANSTQKRVREEVLKQFRRRTVRSQYMYKTFESFETEGFDESIDPSSILDSMKKRGAQSNQSQEDAIIAGIQTRDIALVLGPPGTGKTTVIVEWVLHFIKEKKRILISSKNNKAVDNVFERIAKFREQEEYKNLGMIRIGNIDKVQANVREFVPENQHDAIGSIINSSVDVSISKTLEDKARIETVKSELERIKSETEGFFTHKRRLRDKYNNIHKIASELVELKKIIQKCESERKEIFAQINIKKIYLEEAEKKNFIIKFLTQFITKRVKKEYDELILKVEDTKKYSQAVEEYNALAPKLRDACRDEELKKLKEEYAGLLEETFKIERGIKASFILPIEDIDFTLTESLTKLDDFSQSVIDIEKRIDNLSTIFTEWKNNVNEKNNGVLTEILIGNASVIGATCIGINSNRNFRNVNFDVAIIDEAGQIQVHDIIVPMSRAKKTLMLGDHKQIPPIASEEMLEYCKASRVNTELLTKSFFEYIFENKRFPQENKFMLNTQFRMPEEIADVLSKKFYEGKYLSSENKVGLESLCPGIFERPFVVIDTRDNPPEYRHETEVDGKYFNKCEINIVTKLLESMKLGEGNPVVSLNQIGIITPYKRQAELLRENVLKNFKQLTKTQAESMIATLDSFQGQERELIIYSFTRSNSYGSIGFLTELRRINVAMSRCKSQLVLLGDFEFLTSFASLSGQTVNIDDDDTDADDSKTKDEQKAEFSQFMQMVLDAVKSGSGQYIMSKELNDGK